MYDKELICKKCGPTFDYSVIQNGPHNQAKCNKCNSHLAFVKKSILSEDSDSLIIYFGRHKGKMIKEVDDIEWLIWSLSNVDTLNIRYKIAIQNRIDDIKFNEV